MNSSHSSTSDAFGFGVHLQPLSPEAIQLSAEQIEDAQSFARQVQDPALVWPLYVRHLAHLGFEQWLQTRLGMDATTVALQTDQMQAADGFPQNLVLDVAGFRVCLISQGHQPEERLLIPQACVDDPQHWAHLYALVCVAEEQGTVEVSGVLRQDQLMQNRAWLAATAADAAAENGYQVPFSWFDPDPNRLLLYLRCSEPAAFEQAVSSIARVSAAVPSTAASLTAALSTVNPSADISRSRSSLQQAVVNTALWLNGQLDEVAQALAWQLLPPPQLQGALRSSSGTLREVPEDSNYFRLIQALRERQVEIPERVRPAYRDVALSLPGEVGQKGPGQESSTQESSTQESSIQESSIQDRATADITTPDATTQSVRLYALSWPVESTELENPEWSLVLIVGPTPGEPLPSGISLIVEEQTQVLVDQQLNEADEYLYAEVIGGLEERFHVKLRCGEAVVQTLPVFSFQPPQG